MVRRAVPLPSRLASSSHAPNCGEAGDAGPSLPPLEPPGPAPPPCPPVPGVAPGGVVTGPPGVCASIATGNAITQRIATWNSDFIVIEARARVRLSEITMSGPRTRRGSPDINHLLRARGLAGSTRRRYVGL